MTTPQTDLPSAFVQAIGARLEEQREGYARMALLIEEKHLNPGGVMHGGVLTTLMDETAGAVLAGIRGMEAMRAAPPATVEMNVSFLSAARPGDEIIVEGSSLRVGRSIAFGEAEVRKRGSNDLIAKGRFTFAIPVPRSA